MATGYVAALAGAGWDAVEVPAGRECPDGVFVEDTVVMIGGTAVITNPGAESRRPETVGTLGDRARAGLPDRDHRAGGHLDGGDVLKVGSMVYVGRGGRTDAAGVAEFRAGSGTVGRTGWSRCR